METNQIIKTLSLHLIDKVGNAISFGVSDSIAQTVKDMQQYSKLVNDSLYYMQIKTFLDTSNDFLNEVEVNDFFEKNQDNLRLAAEIFKILEQTHLEKQSEYIAKVFVQYVKNEITNQKLHQYIYIIEQLNTHILNLLDEDLSQFKRFFYEHKLEVDLNSDINYQRFLSVNVSTKQELQFIGFINKNYIEQKFAFDGKIKTQATYERTDLYFDFYKSIILG